MAFFADSVSCISIFKIILPSLGVNFEALERRLRRIWRKRSASLMKFSQPGPSRYTSNLWFILRMPGSTIVIISCSSSGRHIGAMLIEKLPFSILDISSTSLISPRRWWLDKRIFWRQSFTRSWSPIWAAAISAIPVITFMGVRISWLMRERKSDFAAFAYFAASRALLSMSVRSSSLRWSSLNSVISVISINIDRNTGSSDIVSMQVLLKWNHRSRSYLSLIRIVASRGSPLLRPGKWLIISSRLSPDITSSGSMAAISSMLTSKISLIRSLASSITIPCGRMRCLTMNPGIFS